MASAIFSRLLPPGNGEPSIYETLRENEDNSDQSDIEERAGMALDEENLGEGFQDYELDDNLAYEAASPNTLSKVESSARIGNGLSTTSRTAPSRVSRSSRKPLLEDPNDDVPQSLLFEGDDIPVAEARKGGSSNVPHLLPSPTTPNTQAQWRRAQEQQRLHPAPEVQSLQRRYVPQRNRISAVAQPREQAMWRWANVENLDNFLKDVYDYFLGNGMKCILLSRLLNLL